MREMAREANKVVVWRVLEEIWGQSNVAVAEELLAQDYKRHDPLFPSSVIGLRGFLEAYWKYDAIFADRRLNIEQVIEMGETVVSRWSVRGTYRRPDSARVGAGRPVAITGVTISRVVDGFVVEEWAEWDSWGLVKQLGVIGSAELDVLI